ncbi:hypothetical protein HMPREF0083_03735 [Aneurinibacillus aneurinilyticus ATCC 12856]|uniref:Uncharacterized protein n=1 Tax=Aneurinibacillus aneurinilyticus ATCC 12856 TaxID=649747 RepID=U1WZL7_ANEAE|nr:hypothetical protein HMPREF0083_03735 [Aneurinibacillus aneurinilyticus ATCC 12856]
MAPPHIVNIIFNLVNINYKEAPLYMSTKQKELDNKFKKTTPRQIGRVLIYPY